VLISSGTLGFARAVVEGPGTFTGGTAVNGGILEVADATALGSGPVSIANTGAAKTTHSLRPANVSLSNDIEISYRYTEDFAGAITAAGGGRSTLTGAGAVPPSRSMSPAPPGWRPPTGSRRPPAFVSAAAARAARSI